MRRARQLNRGHPRPHRPDDEVGHEP
jgi:hypothetical protein